MPIKAISFDFWHTLFTEQFDASLLYQDKRRSMLANALLSCRDFGDGELESACAVESESHVRMWEEQHRTALASERVGRILDHLEVCLPDDSLTALVVGLEELLLEHPPILIDGARDALTQLAKRYRLGIISDVGFSPGRVLKQVLANHDLLDLFDSLVFSDEAGRAKPHLEVFKRTARALEADPGEMVHVGDLERTDIIGAKQAGYRAIRFTGISRMEKGETTIADLVTDDLADIPRLVGILDEGLE